MAIVRLEEVIKRVQTKENKENTDRIYYVGGEHIDSENFRVTRRGLIEGSTIGPMFYYGFKAGDFLLVSRNPHLKKAGVVNFDGICSEKTFVLATADEDRLLPEFLPFVLQNDLFWDYACQHRHGSTNTFINWSTLASYEFELPDIQAQRRIANVLWTILDTIDSYKKLIAATDELVKAQFVEMFGNLLINDKGWQVYCIGDVTTSRLGKMLDAKKQTGKYLHPYLANVNVQWFRFDLDNLNQMDFDEADQVEFELKPRDLMVCEGGEIGRCAIWNGEIKDCYYQKAIHRIRCNENFIIPEYLAYLFYYHSQVNGFSDIVSNKVTIAHLPGDKLKSMKIMIPPLSLQKAFAAFVGQADKSKFELERALAAAKAVMKGIVEEKLG